MSTSMVGNWELPDQEYYAITEDYALVGESAKIIRSEIDEANRFVPRPGKEPRFYSDLGRLQQRLPIYDFLGCGNHIIYADVDNSNAKHEEKVKGIRRKEQRLGFLEHGGIASISDSARAARLALSKELSEAWKGRYVPDRIEDLEPGSDLKKACDAEEVDFQDWKGAELSEIFDELQSQRADLSSELINYIVGAGYDHRQELMYWASCQGLSPNKRPVMILIDMIDSMQSSTRGTKTGWALAYDVVEQQIIVKPFFSDSNHHPLASSWTQPVADDGVSIKQQPLEFVTQYLKLAQEIGDKGSEKDTEDEKKIAVHDVEVAQPLAFRILVHTFAAKWVIRHWGGLFFHGSSSTEETNALFIEIQDARNKLKNHLTRIPFSAASKPSPTEAHEKRIVVHPVAELEWSLVEMEDYFRSSAIQAKEQGEDKIAGNVKVLYERILMLMQAFNVNPRGELGSR